MGEMGEWWWGKLDARDGVGSRRFGGVEELGSRECSLDMGGGAGARGS